MPNARGSQRDRLQRVVWKGKSYFMRKYLSGFCLGCTMRSAFRGVLRVGQRLAGAFWGILGGFVRLVCLWKGGLDHMGNASLPSTDLYVRSSWAIIRVFGGGCSHCRKKLPLVFETHRGTEHSFRWRCPLCRSLYERARWDDIVLGGDAGLGRSEERIQFQPGEILFAEDAEIRPLEECLSELSK